jgi:hypothetical protein
MHFQPGAKPTYRRARLIARLVRQIGGHRKMEDGQRCKICRWIIRIRDGKEYAQVYIGGDVFQLRPHKCKKNPPNQRLEPTPDSGPTKPAEETK